MRSLVSLAAAVALAGGISIGAQSAQATTLSFNNISNNSGVDVAGQLSVLVEDLGTDVSFTFFNNIGIDSSVTAVYFDDAIPLLGSATITGSPVGPSLTAVNFSEGASPGGGNLPGGAAHSFSADYSAGADTPSPHNGINEATDWLKIVFELLAGMSFTDIIAALTTGDLRVGLHVQSIAGAGGDDSDQFLNAPIPLPAGLLLFLTGLAGIGFLGRYKARRRETAAA